MQDRLTVGFITKPHGVKGAVKVFPATDDIKRFKPGQKYYLEAGGRSIPVESESVQYFKQYAIIKLDILGTPEEAEAFRGCALTVERSDAVKLKKDEYFISDLEGMKVYTDEPEKFTPAYPSGEKQPGEIGTVTDVLSTGANEVFVVSMNQGCFDGKMFAQGNEVLLPSIKDCIKDIDVENGRITVHIMPGLLD
ncbi:MAG: 16S rRNA processing protein RimM [Lachnospiraceae bacterium]|nr:16S rRNA processing protein RimM [Lachnospiraceae bacterium]MBR5376189.1 16S rRNA processing protein RimM [Lachnospiraceae bacterium]